MTTSGTNSAFVIKAESPLTTTSLYNGGTTFTNCGTSIVSSNYDDDSDSLSFSSTYLLKDIPKL